MSDARRFIDRHGFSWQVCELWPPPGQSAPREFADAAPLSRGWLYFFSRGTTLVLRDYPAGWAELSWEELDALRQRSRVLGSDTGIRLPRRQALAATAADGSPASSAR